MMQESRIFNADVGDRSINNAGPDAIEKDLDNIYQNKAWRKDVLTKDNEALYVPTTPYNPATKEYVDNNSGSNTEIINNNISIIQTDVISADVAQLMNAWITNLFVEVLNTNFEDYLTGVRVDNGYLIGNTKLERRFVKSEKEGIRLYQQILSLDSTDFILTNGEDEIQVYYTSVRGAYAYKFFTIQNPVALAGDWTKNIKYSPYKIIKGEDGLHYYTTPSYSQEGYEHWEDALPHLIRTTSTEHKVKVKTVVNQYEKFSAEFKDLKINEETTIKEVMLTLGVGDGVTEKSAKAEIYKSQTGLQLNYYRSNTGEVRNISIDDNGIHTSMPVYNANSNIRNIIVTTDEPNASMGNVNDIIIQV